VVTQGFLAAAEDAFVLWFAQHDRAGFRVDGDVQRVAGFYAELPAELDGQDDAT